MAAPRIRTSPTMPVPPKLKPPYTTGATPMGHSPNPDDARQTRPLQREDEPEQHPHTGAVE